MRCSSSTTSTSRPSRTSSTSCAPKRCSRSRRWSRRPPSSGGRPRRRSRRPRTAGGCRDSTSARSRRVPAAARPGWRTLFVDGNTDRFISTDSGSASNPADWATLRLSATDDIVVSGWALDPPRKRSASAVDFVISGRIYRTAIRGARGDVAHAYGCQDYFRCGFTTTFPASVLAPGAHDVEIRVLVNGGRYHVSATRLRLELVYRSPWRRSR